MNANPGPRDPSGTSPGDGALPSWTAALGYGGWLPFAALTLALWVAPDPALQRTLLRALLAYGAVILAFLGAVHWGLALARRVPNPSLVLALGVVPALVGAASLALAPGETALVVQMIGFGAVWLYEHRVLGEAVLPRAYLDLRRVLTVGVLTILLIALFGPVQQLGVA